MTTKEKVSFIDKINPQLSLGRQAELLNIARSTIYYQPRVNQTDLGLMNRIDQIHTDAPFFGARKIMAALKRQGIHIGRDKTQGLMRRLDIQAVFPGKNTSRPHPNHEKHPYLLKGLKIARPDQVWGTDITYIRLLKGWAYLTVMLDWFSRCVTAWMLSSSLESSFCLDTLKNALEPGRVPEIHNSDQGSQFTSAAYLGILKAKGIKN